MIGSQVFVDTNILVYAHDRAAGDKHTLAKERIRELWSRHIPPAISVQVLQELYVNLVRKGVGHAEAAETVEDYSTWDVVENDLELLKAGIDSVQRWQTSFWDALILSAAIRSKASILWSEDFNVGQTYDGVLVQNPLE
jgi:predicted nucleic acid-binding protein